MRQYLGAMYAFEKRLIDRFCDGAIEIQNFKYVNKLRDFTKQKREESNIKYKQILDVICKLPPYIYCDNDIYNIIDILDSNGGWLFAVEGSCKFFDQKEVGSYIEKLFKNENVSMSMVLGPIIIANNVGPIFTSNSTFKNYIMHGDESCNMYYSAYYQFLHWRIAYSQDKYYIHIESPHGIGEIHQYINVCGTEEELKEILNILVPIKNEIESISSSDPFDKNWIWPISGAFFPIILEENQLLEFTKYCHHGVLISGVILNNYIFCQIVDKKIP